MVKVTVNDPTINNAGGFFPFPPLPSPDPCSQGHLQLYAITSPTHFNSWRKAKAHLTTHLQEAAYVVN